MSDDKPRDIKNTSQGSFIPEEPHKVLVEEAADDIVATAPDRQLFAADLYRTLVENSHDVLFSLDIQGTFTYISPAIERLAQYQASEVIGQPFTRFVHPDDLTDVETNFQQALSGDLEPFELRIFNRAGSVRQVRISTRPLWKDGQLVGLTGVLVDITESKRAEEALRESEGRYQTLFEDSPISLWEEDFSQVKKHFDDLRTAGVTDFRAYFENRPEAVRYCAELIKVLDVNKATLALVGVSTKGELLNPLSPVLADESLPVVQEELIVLAEGKQRFESEMLHRTMAGEIKFVTLHVSVAPGHENTLDKVLVSIHDVTERKQAEDALRHAHDEMEERVNQQTAELRRANKQLTALYQVSQAITTLSQLKVVLDVIARSAAELLSSDTGVILLVDEAGETLTIQGAFGLSEAVVKGTRDRVGESIAGRVVQTGQPLIVNDLPNDPRFYNPSAVDEGLLACASVPLVVGKKIIGTLDIHSKTNRYAFNEEHIHVLNMLASQAAIAIENARLYEQLQLAHDELEIRVQQRTVELVAANAQLQQDIIERKRAEKEKDALQMQLLQAQKMESVGRLAGGVAHDYNNMLAVILIQVQLALRESDPSQPIYARLQAIQQATQHSIDLTRQLLTFARKQTITPKILNMNETVEGALAMLHRLIGENINLLWKPAANLWSVKMDPVQINQILANLVVNARDAISGVGKVIIETENATFDEAYCAVHPDSVSGDYVVLTVSDNGIGMEKDTLEHLFEPFFTTKEIGKGTGLGLSTVYGIVKQNEGFINIHSEPGKGSIFRIYLPRFASEAEKLAVTQAAEPPKGHGETIMLVDDEPEILNMCQEILEELGYQVLSADMPSKAIQLAEEHSGEIHLLITDVIMPEMNGPDLVKRLQLLYPNLKWLFMSGYMTNIITRQGIPDKDAHFFQKPFTIKDLAVRVHNALNQK